MRIQEYSTHFNDRKKKVEETKYIDGKRTANHTLDRSDRPSVRPVVGQKL